MIERESAPSGEDLKLEVAVEEALREWSCVDRTLNEPSAWQFREAEWFRRYVELSLKFVPRALVRLQRLRNHNLLLRKALFAIKKDLRAPASAFADYGRRHARIIEAVEKILAEEAPL